jgi:hypothetical protein
VKVQAHIWALKWTQNKSTLCRIHSKSFECWHLANFPKSTSTGHTGSLKSSYTVTGIIWDLKKYSCLIHNERRFGLVRIWFIKGQYEYGTKLCIHHPELHFMLLNYSTQRRFDLFLNWWCSLYLGLQPTAMLSGCMHGAKTLLNQRASLGPAHQLWTLLRLSDPRMCSPYGSEVGASPIARTQEQPR